MPEHIPNHATRPAALLVTIALLFALALALGMLTPIAPVDAQGLTTQQPLASPTPVGGCVAAQNFVQGEVVYVRSGVNVRHLPTLSGAMVNYFVENVVAYIDDGPICADGYNWWHIIVQGNDGWIADGDIQFGPFLQSSGFNINEDPIVRGCAPPLSLRTEPRAYLLHNVRIRAEPGQNGRVLTVAPYNTFVEVLDGPQCYEGLNWWFVRTEVVNIVYEGWMAEGVSGNYYAINESTLTASVCSPPLNLPIGTRGAVTYNDSAPKSLRAAPGVESELLYTLVRGVPFIVVGGPVCVDDMNWWQIRVLASTEVVGWMGEGGPSNYWIAVIIRPTPVPSATSPPVATAHPTFTPTATP